MEHSYSLPPAQPELVESVIRVPPTSMKVKHPKMVKLMKSKDKIHKVEKQKSKKYTKVHSSHQNHEGEKENIRNDYIYDKLPKPVPEPTVTYKERDLMSEMGILYEFLTRGIDAEDVEYLRSEDGPSSYSPRNHGGPRILQVHKRSIKLRFLHVCMINILYFQGERAIVLCVGENLQRHVAMSIGSSPRNPFGLSQAHNGINLPLTCIEKWHSARFPAASEAM
jgi:hypothetical protein